MKEKTIQNEKASFALSDEKQAQYQRDGYLFPIQIFDKNEISHYRNAFNELENRMGGRLTKAQGLEPALFYKWAYDLATSEKILDVVESIIGRDILIHSSTIFCKYPQDPSFISWHQDGYNWKLTQPKLVSAWIALSQSNADNGCMRVVPGTHGERLNHTHEVHKDNMVRSGLTIERAVDENEVVDIELNPGEISLHHVRIIHGSRPNHSMNKRIGFAVRYVATSVNQNIQNHDVILARGEDKFGNYSLLPSPPSGDMEESIRQQLAFAQST